MGGCTSQADLGEMLTRVAAQATYTPDEGAEAGADPRLPPVPSSDLTLKAGADDDDVGC